MPPALTDLYKELNVSWTMQALSHYSYHFSDGQRLVCDLQGGHYGEYYILTDPVIEVKGGSRELFHSS